MRQDDRLPFVEALRRAREAAYEPGEYVEQESFMRASEIRELAERAGVAPGVSVLDLCCGPGRYSVELAKMGYQVTGVDRTRPYLDKARDLAATYNASVEFVEDDMRHFVRPAAFDAALSLFTSFGYFEDPEDDRRVLRNLCASLRPGGRLAVDVTGKETLARIYTPRDWMEFADGALLLFDREVEPGWNTVWNRWLFLKGGDKFEFKFTHRIYSSDSLARELTDAGFIVEGIYGGLDGSPYNREAKRLVAVAAKP